MAHEKVEVEGRPAHVYSPFSAKAPQDQTLPVIFVLHGSYSSPEDMYAAGFEPLADAMGFLVVYPEMSTPSGPEWGYKDDIPFFSALVHKLVAEHHAAGEKAYICGHSAGGTMALYLQNQVDLFAGAAAISAGVGKLSDWDMSLPGQRTVLVWNHADPVLAQYGGEGLFRETVRTLRRHGSKEPESVTSLDTSGLVQRAELMRYSSKGPDPELLVLSWRSEPGMHEIPRKPLVTFSAAEVVVAFLFDAPSGGSFEV